MSKPVDNHLMPLWRTGRFHGREGLDVVYVTHLTRPEREAYNQGYAEGQHIATSEAVSFAQAYSLGSFS